MVQIFKGTLQHFCDVFRHNLVDFYIKSLEVMPSVGVNLKVLFHNMTEKLILITL